MMASRSSIKHSFVYVFISIIKVLYLANGCGYGDSEYDKPIVIGDKHLAKGKYNAAISAYRLALHKDTLDYVIWARLAKVYSAQGNIGAATTYLRKSAAGFLGAGQNAMDSGNDSLAFVHYSNLLDLDPSNSMAHIFLGDIHNRSGDKRNAISCYLKATKLDSLNYNTWVRLGNVYRQSKDTKRAVDAYKKAIRFNINSHPSYMGLGSIYLARQEFNLAEDYFNTALLVKPDLAEARSALEYINSLKK